MKAGLPRVGADGILLANLPSSCLEKPRNCNLFVTQSLTKEYIARSMHFGGLAKPVVAILRTRMSNSLTAKRALLRFEIPKFHRETQSRLTREGVCDHAVTNNQAVEYAAETFNAPTKEDRGFEDSVVISGVEVPTRFASSTTTPLRDRNSTRMLPQRCLDRLNHGAIIVG